MKSDLASNEDQNWLSGFGASITVAVSSLL